MKKDSVENSKPLLNEVRAARYFQILKELADMNPAGRLEFVEMIKQCWREEASDKLRHVPEKLEAKFSEADEAFQQLHRVIKMLDLPTEAVKPIDWSEMGEELLKNKKYGEALEAFRKAIAADLPDVKTLLFAATAAYHSGSHEYAESYADQAMRIDPENVRAVMLKGLVRFECRDFSNALFWFEIAKKLRPDSETVIRYLKKAAEGVVAEDTHEMRPPEAEVEVAEAEEAMQAFNQTSDPKARRRWRRRFLKKAITLNDISAMWPLSATIKSLSAGGCLLESFEGASQIPDEVNFHLDLNGKNVHGTARKIYMTNGKEIGLRFTSLKPDEEDAINQLVMGAR